MSGCEWRFMGRSFLLVTKPREGEKVLHPAPVKLMGEISGENFKLVSDGKWTAKYVYRRSLFIYTADYIIRFVSDTPLHRAKASGMIHGGYDDDVLKIWAQQLGGVINIQNSRKSGTVTANSISQSNSEELKMRHSLFRVRDHTSHIMLKTLSYI